MSKYRLIRGHMILDDNSDDDDIVNNDLLHKFQNYVNPNFNNCSLDVINNLTNTCINLNNLHNQYENNDLIKSRLIIILIELLNLSDKFNITLEDLIKYKLNE